MNLIFTDFGEVLKGIWESTGFYGFAPSSGFDWQSIVMILIAVLLLYLAIFKEAEPYLLIPMGIGMLLSNLPFTGIMDVDPNSASGYSGLLGVLYLGVKYEIYPCLIFMGIGATTDFGPLISNPKTLILGAAAQIGIFLTFLLAILVPFPSASGWVHFTPQQAASIGIIGGADGPTAILTTTKLAPELLANIAIAAYSYMALVPFIQPPIIRALKIKNIKFANYSSLLDGGINIIILIMYLLLLGFGAYSLIEVNPTLLGNIKDSGQFITFAGYTDTLIWPLMACGILINEVSNAKAASQRISTILDEKELQPDTNNCLSHFSIKGLIEFRNLNFTYPQSKEPAVKNISFKIKPGEMIGIIGRTGSGKSTLVSLLEKLYEIQPGQLFIDGDDINLWKKEDLREHIGFVAQTSYLFSGTVKDSIAFSESDSSQIDESKMVQAARFASVDQDISQMENGYSTLVGEKGSSVSGGQRQRISIARAIYKHPDVLILDDSLSAVDADTEKNILSNIRSLENKITTLIITHRISALENCDQILVLDNGELIGKGTHNELLENCPLYKNISEMQKLEKEVN